MPCRLCGTAMLSSIEATYQYGRERMACRIFHACRGVGRYLEQRMQDMLIFEWILCDKLENAGRMSLENGCD